MAILANSTTPVAKTLLLIIRIFLSLFTRCRKLPQAETHQVWTRFLAARDPGKVINLGDLLRRSVKAGQLYSRPGNDLTRRFPLIFEALARLKARTGIIDGEAVACGPDGIALFDLIRYRRHDEHVFLRAFDIIELNADDLRREALVSRKATLAIALAGVSSGIELNEHIEHGDGALVFQHACKLGFEGIVSKRKHSHYQSGRCPLDEDEESELRCCDAGGRGGVGALNLCPTGRARAWAGSLTGELGSRAVFFVSPAPCRVAPSPATPVPPACPGRPEP